MIIQEVFKGNDKEKLIDYKENIVNELNKIDLDQTSVKKLDAILEKVGSIHTELKEHTKTVTYRENVHSLELNNVLNKIRENLLKEIDPIKYEHLFRAGLRLIEAPETYDIKPTSLIDAIQKPVPDGLPFMYAGENNVKIRAGVPTVIGAYTGIGKSSLMLNMAYSYYKIGTNEKDDRKKLSQWIYSLEMPDTDIAVSLLQLNIKDELNKSKVDPEKHNMFLNSYIVHKHWEQHAEQLFEINSRITVFNNDNRTKNTTIKEIETRLQYAKATETLPDIVYIDYLQIIGIEKQEQGQDRRYEIIDIMGRLAQLAKMYNIFLVILSQANRGGVDSSQINITNNNGYYSKAPSMSSLQESAFIEQTAGLVIMVGRAYLKIGSNDILEVSIDKNRYGASRIQTYYDIDKISRSIGAMNTDFKNEIEKSSKTHK